MKAYLLTCRIDNPSEARHTFDSVLAQAGCLGGRLVCEGGSFLIQVYFDCDDRLPAEGSDETTESSYQIVLVPTGKVSELGIGNPYSEIGESPECCQPSLWQRFAGWIEQWQVAVERGSDRTCESSTWKEIATPPTPVYVRSLDELELLPYVPSDAPTSVDWN